MLDQYLLLGMSVILSTGGGALSVSIEVGRAKDASATMDSLAPVSGDLMRNWLDQWGF